jgi:hypothetical protein
MLIIAREVDGDRVVLGLFEKRHDTMPVPGNATSTRNENEGSHALLSPVKLAMNPVTA